MTPLRAVLRYRDLLQVEDLFRRTKAIMRTRPIFHSSDAAIRGHVFCSFLSLAMPKHLDDLQHRLDDAEKAASAPTRRLSLDGKDQLFTLTVTFPSSDVGKGRIVMSQIHAIANGIEARNPGTKIEFAGSINISIFEHDSVISGMALAAAITDIARNA